MEEKEVYFFKSVQIGSVSHTSVLFGVLFRGQSDGGGRPFCLNLLAGLSMIGGIHLLSCSYKLMACAVTFPPLLYDSSF